MKLDLRPRCHRPRCDKLIRRGKMAQANYERYKPYCSYNCAEWHRLEGAPSLEFKPDQQVVDLLRENKELRYELDRVRAQLRSCEGEYGH